MNKRINICMDRGAFYARHKLVKKRNNRDILSSILKVAKNWKWDIEGRQTLLNPYPLSEKKKEYDKEYRMII